MNNNKKCDQLLDYFNGHLSKSEEETFELHLLDCEDCQEQLQELYELNDQVADLPSNATPPTGMKERIFDSIFEQDAPSNPTIRPVSKSEPVPFINKRNKLMPWLAATAAVLAAAIGTNIYSFNQLNETQSQLTAIETERDILSTERDILSSELDEYVRGEEDPTTTPTGIEQVITSTSLLSLEDESEHLGQASIVQQDDGYKLIVQVEQLPELTDSEVYQIWLFQEETPLPAGSFVTNEAGEGAIIYDLDSDTNIEDLFEAIAISLEPQPDNQAPEGPVLTVSDLY